jgi:putative ABC transport system permease protein
MFERSRRALRNLFRQPAVDRDLDDELAAYEDLLAAEKRGAGASPEQARREARLHLEGSDAVKEAVRDVRSGATLEQIVRDLRYVFRTLRRSPGFALFSVLTFAVAIGGLTVIFSLVNALLLEPLPYPRSQRLVMVVETWSADPTGVSTVAAPNYLDWKARNRVFSGMALYEYMGVNLTDGGEPEQVGAIRVTGGVFDVLGVAPMLGRGLLPADDAPGTRVVVLSHRTWQGRYGADSSLVGKTIQINGQASLVVGVMPKGFAFPSVYNQLWLPIDLKPEDLGRASHSFWGIARLSDSVTLEQARSEMRGIGNRLAREYPADNTGETVNVFPMRDLWVQSTRSVFRTLLAAVGLVLVIASANIASLQVARHAARRREIAARLALGGSPYRIVRQLVTESCVLALGGAVLGLMLAGAGIRALLTVVPFQLLNLPFRDLSSLSVDVRVVVVALGAALLAGLLAGVAPALTALPGDPAELLRDAGARSTATRHSRRLKSVLVAVEVALAVVVLAGAGLLVESTRRLQRVAPGLDPANLMALNITLPQADFYGPAERTSICSDIRREVGAVVGVESVSAVSHLPLSGANAGRSFVLEGAPDPGPADLPSASYGVVCPGYFRTMGIPLLSGADFTEAHRAGTPPVVIVNQAFARRWFPGTDPVGRRIKLGRFESSGPWITIIGVAGDVRHHGLAQPADAYLYAPYAQAAWPQMRVMVRTAGPGVAVAPVREALRRAAPADAIGEINTMEQVVRDSLGLQRFPMILFSIFGALGLALAGLGCFGVASQSVVQRRRELGIRIALGARIGQVYRLVLHNAMIPVAAGVAVGIAGALAFTRVLRGLLFEITPGNPTTLLSSAVLLSGVALAAFLLPARRAAQVDPAKVLRED